METWRLILDPHLSGADNMAFDEAILNAVGAGNQPPTLRLYGWNPPCLSLGYGQRLRDVDLERLAVFGWDIVRRPTGGRAILHADELTYSLALPITHPLAQGNIVESYRRISDGLLAALQQLGADAHADPAEKSAQPPNPICFETTSHYEIAVDGRKLVGSAQLRRDKALLQHGSLPLKGDIGRICDVLAYSDERERQQARIAVHERALTLAEALGGREIAWETAAAGLIDGFCQTFVLSFNQESLSDAERADAERADAERLKREKYAASEWTHKR